jgi:hypothetical protein
MEEKGRSFPDLGGSDRWGRERGFRGDGRRGEELPAVAVAAGVEEIGSVGGGAGTHLQLVWNVKIWEAID